MMPSPTSVGQVPMATTQDPSIQCFVDGCFYVGTGRCNWVNPPCRSKKSGGCGKRFCYQHKYEKVQTIRGKHQTYTVMHQCCQDCGEEMEADFEANRSTQCYASLICILCFITISFIPMIIIFTMGPE